MHNFQVSRMLWSMSLVLILLPAVLAQSVTWKFPAKGDGIRANAIDTVLIDWTSTFNRTILRMWCTNSIGDQALASSYEVNDSGPLKYILADYDPVEQGFAYPLICHGELANKTIGAGVDSPGGFEFINNPSLAAKTISQTASPESTSSTTTTSSTISTSSSSTPTSITSAELTSSPTIPTTLQTNTPNLVTTSTQSSTAVPPPSGSSNNIGAIVGGAIGGLALICFVVLGLLFLRKYKRNHSHPTSPGPGKTPSPTTGFTLLGIFKKRGGNTSAAVHEKDDDHRIYEKEGATTQIASANGAVKYKGPRGENGDQILLSPVELPANTRGNNHWS